MRTGLLAGRVANRRQGGVGGVANVESGTGVGQTADRVLGRSQELVTPTKVSRDLGDKVSEDLES